MMHPGRLLALGIALLPAITGCLSVTTDPRALLQRDDGTPYVQTLVCERGMSAAARKPATGTALDPSAIRIVTWNIHKQGDAGWERDLRTFSAESDILLLQETVLDALLQQVIENARLRFVMASSFLHDDTDIGVLTASRVKPVATCTQRVVEPLLRLPKSAVITWFELEGQSSTLAVVNVHAINFSLSVGAYRAQFGAIVDVLVDHDGPIILAGDLNTWTAERKAVVKTAAQRLNLAEIAFADDRRRLFFGHQLDHIYTRALDVVRSSAIPVTSSDHNPVSATLRVAH